MSLTDKKIEDTKYELKSNLKKADFQLMKISKDLLTSQKYIKQLFELNPTHLEDTWILRNYLIEFLNEKSIEITPFTSLVGKSENYWFLDSNYIKKVIK